MTAKERLEELLSNPQTDGEWIIGNIPRHFKRCSLKSTKTMDKYAKFGYAEFFEFYNEDIRLFYSQALIAGAILSGDFDEIIIVSPSQYGKSWLMGHIGLKLAYDGFPTYIAASTASMTGIIMEQLRQAVGDTTEEVQLKLDGVTKNNITRLNSALNKNKIAFAESSGFAEAVTLGASYEDLSKNQALGRGGAYIIDEAALVPDQCIRETGRADLARIDGKKYPRIFISNPHNPGLFYDKLTQDNPSDRTFILWLDALTALEEGRFTKDVILTGEYAQHKEDIIKYWLCELAEQGSSMFDKPVVNDSKTNNEKSYFLGIDSAYKGKDNIEVCLSSIDENGISIEEIYNILKGEWIDGVTSEDIIDQIMRVYRYYNVEYICVDIGMGVWLVEGLARRGALVKGIHFQSRPDKERIRAKHYAAVNASNKRAELHLDLQDLIETKRICFTTNAYDKIKKVLPFVTCKRNANGKVQIRKKEEIKALIKGKSPDELDACLLSIHACIMYNAYNHDYII